MGIKNLTKFLKSKFPSIYEKQSLINWENKKIAVDSSIYIYKFKSCAIKDATYIHNFQYDTENGWNEPSDELVNSCYKKRFEQFLAIFRAHKINPVFIFDGKAPEEKKDTRKKRREKIQTMFDQKDKFKKDKTKLSDYRNMLSFCVSIKENDFKILNDVLLENNIQKMTAKGEAEHLASFLCKKLEVDAVVSTDTDVLAYGCPIVWVNMTQQLGIWMVEMIKFEKLLNMLKITEEQFLSLCIMCGTDFNSSIKNYGPVRCLKLVQEFVDFDKIKEKHPVFNNITFDKTYQIMKQEPQMVQP